MKTDLQYDEYKKYEILECYCDDIKELGFAFAHRFKFPNGYGASVIKQYGSYGYEKDLFELAVLEFYSNEYGELTYDTPITNDVIGYLTNYGVLKYLEQIKNLKSIYE